MPVSAERAVRAAFALALDAALARWLYDHPVEREYGDIDLVVDPDCYRMPGRPSRGLAFRTRARVCAGRSRCHMKAPGCACGSDACASTFTSRRSSGALRVHAWLEGDDRGSGGLHRAGALAAGLNSGAAGPRELSRLGSNCGRETRQFAASRGTRLLGVLLAALTVASESRVRQCRGPGAWVSASVQPRHSNGRMHNQRSGARSRPEGLAAPSQAPPAAAPRPAAGSCPCEAACAALRASRSTAWRGGGLVHGRWPKAAQRAA